MPEGLNPDHEQWHPRRRRAALYDQAVTNATDTRASALTGLAAVLVAGGAAFVSLVTGSWQPPAATATAWSLAYGVYLVVYLLDAEILVRRPLLPARPAAVLLLLAGLAVWFLAPELNWMATLFVVTTASWTSLVRRRALVAVVGVQSAAVTVGMALAGADAGPPRAVTDVVPLSADDARGTTLAAASFPLVLGGLVGGVVVSLTVAGTWRRVTAIVVHAALGGPAVAGLLHGLGGLHGAYLADSLAVGLALLGIGATIVGAVGLLGRPGLAAGLVLFLLVANPLSAAAVPVEFLLSPWGAVGQWFPPGASATLLRDLSYFPGADTTFPWLVLTGWAALGLTLSLAGRARDRGAATSPALRGAEVVSPVPAPAPSAR